MCAIFEHKYYAADKEVQYLRSLILNNKCRYQVPDITQRNHQKWEQYCGSADCLEGDIDSEFNCLASGNIWKYITVLSQCQ